MIIQVIPVVSPRFTLSNDTYLEQGDNDFEDILSKEDGGLEPSIELGMSYPKVPRTVLNVRHRWGKLFVHE